MEKQEILEYAVIFAAVLIVFALISIYKGSTGADVFIVSTVPADGQVEVALNSSITLAFNKAMDRNATEAAFFLEDSSGKTGGIFEWDTENTTMAFVPSVLLEKNATYSAGVSADAKDAAGNKLAAGYFWAFTTSGEGISGGNGSGGKTNNTAAPEILLISPADGATEVQTNSEIVLMFSEPMNRTETEAAFSVSPAAPGTFEWEGNDKKLNFRPSQSLQTGTQYEVALSQNAKSAKGKILFMNYSWKFATAAVIEPDNDTQNTTENNSNPPVETPETPHIISVSPANGATGVPLAAEIQITFDKPMDEAATNNAFSASPYLSEMYFWNADYTVLRITPLNQLSQNTQYTITISAAAKSNAGSPLLSDYVWSFTTQPAAP